MRNEHFSRDDLNRRTGQVVDAALRVHTALGPGLLESAYKACLAYELRKRGMKVNTEYPVPIVYDEVHLEIGYRIDMVVDELIPVELKAVKALADNHEAQLLTHLKLGGFKVGLLINFNERHLKNGIRRRVNDF